MTAAYARAAFYTIAVLVALLAIFVGSARLSAYLAAPIVTAEQTA